MINNLNYLEAFGGFGLLIFSLRYLNSVLSGMISRRFKPLLNRLITSQWNAVFLGFFSTIFVQASSITVISTMGLLSNALINLEQGILIILGSSLGSAVKSLIFSTDIYSYGFFVVGISSFLLIFTRKIILREILSACLAIGTSFLGFYLISKNLEPLVNSEFLQAFFKAPHNDLTNQFMEALVGIGLSVMFQSSSIILFLVMDLGMKDLIQFDMGASIILGANIGTTSTALIFSLEHDKNVKKLAIAYFLIKVIGVLITLFFFPYFLFISELLGEKLFAITSLSTKLAFTNIFFNFVSLIWWYSFYSLVLKFLNTILPTDNTKLVLPSVIRKIVTSNPELAIEELRNQITQIESVTKSLTDSCIDLLNIKKINTRRQISYNFGKDFEVLKEQIYQILIHVNKNYKHNIDIKLLERDFKFLSECSDFYYHALSLHTHLEKGLFIYYYQFPEEVKSYFEKFESLFNQLWLNVLLNKGSSEKITELIELVEKMENTYFEIISNKSGVYSYEYLSWVYETINYLSQMVDHLVNLCKVSPYIKKSFTV